jgi:hypothetical protein
MSRPNILAFVMAGGEGSRLQPLTADRSKPSVPFGARYRIADFVLSNLINSGIHSIYLLVQYKSQSLIEHVRKAWVVSPMRNDEFVTVVPPQMMRGGDWFQGTADSVYQNIELIRLHNPDETHGRKRPAPQQQLRPDDDIPFPLVNLPPKGLGLRWFPHGISIEPDHCCVGKQSLRLLFNPLRTFPNQLHPRA